MTKNTTKPATPSGRLPVSEGQLSYSIPQFCMVSSLGRSIVYEAINAGTLKVKKYKNRSLILRNDAEDFLNDLPAGE